MSRADKVALALTLELVPLISTAIGIGVLILVAAAPVTQPAGLLLPIAVVGFCAAGLGWISVGRPGVGVSLLLGRGTVLLALLRFIGAGWHSGDGSYDGPIAVMSLFVVAVPLVSTAALTIYLWKRRHEHA